MDYRIVWTATAQADLQQLVTYIAADDPIAAERFGFGLVDHVEQTSQQPWSGRKVPEANIEELRELIYSPYRIIYEINEEDKIVYVTRVWHAARGKPKVDQPNKARHEITPSVIRALYVVREMKLPILATIIFSVTVVMTASLMIVFGSPFIFDPEYNTSVMSTRIVIQMMSWAYFFVFSVAALINWYWGLAGYRLGLIAFGLLLFVVNFFGTGKFSVIGSLFMLPVTVVELGLLFAIWKYLGTNEVIAAYAQQGGSLNSEKPEASLHQSLRRRRKNMELEITWKRTIRIWWSYLWRNLIAIAASMIAGAIVGFVVGFILALFAVPTQTIQIVVFPISFVLGLAISIIPLKLILGKDFGEFRLVLVSKDPAIQASVSAPK